MQLPFTNDGFFDVVQAYNTTLWPAIVSLWVASAAVVARLFFSKQSCDRSISALLAVHWAWSAVAYHLVFFTEINPAAWLFAALFLLQAGLFVWAGFIKRNLSFTSSPTVWTPIGWLMVVYALVYPAINVVEHGSLIRVPTFGLPCPTTVFTVGLLLLAPSGSRLLAIVPIIWSVIGGSAALLLGVTADYALPVAGAALALWAALRPKTHHRATEHHPSSVAYLDGALR